MNLLKRLLVTWKSTTVQARTAFVVICVAYISVLGVGLSTPEPMIGDEVTHYFIVVKQAHKLPRPTINAEIPLATGGVYRKSYPHVYLWHYAGAIAWKCFGGSVAVIQVYQSLFWLQLLIAAWLLARGQEQPDSWASCVYLLVTASLPVCLIFSVAFYQDVPAVAQMLTSYLFLRRRKVVLSAFFLGLAMAIKITVFVMIPAYLLCVVLVLREDRPCWKACLRIMLAASIVFVMCMAMSKAMNRVELEYYPTFILKQYIQKMGLARWLPGWSHNADHAGGKNNAIGAPINLQASRPEVVNSPGDLRSAVNYLTYGGGVLWLIVSAAVPGVWFFRKRIAGTVDTSQIDLLALGTGLWILAATGWHMRESPDARFFLAGVLFAALPLCQSIAYIPYRRVWLPLLVVTCVFQSGAVLAKTWSLRHIPGGVKEAIVYLKQNPPYHNYVFMYPEGSYRLFPSHHSWYLGFRLKDFWKADNDERIRMLDQPGTRIGAIVIKKYLVGKIDKDMNNLGIYPDFFVRDIENDKRFVKVLDNRDVAIYLVPKNNPVPK